MRIYPITSFNQLNKDKKQSFVEQKHLYYSSVKKSQYSPNFKSEFNYNMYAKAITAFAKMGIKAENVFLNKNVYKNLNTSQPEIFDSNIAKLSAAHDAIENRVFSSAKTIVEKFLFSEEPDYDKLLFVSKSLNSNNVLAPSCIKIFNYIEQDAEKTNNWNKGLDETCKLLSLRSGILKNISKLKQFHRESSSVDVDSLLFSYPSSTIKALEILGEKGIIYSLNDKMDNVTNYIATLGLYRWIDSVREKLIELTNPRESKKYKNLSDKLTILKSQYDNTLPEDELKTLRREINNVTTEQRNLIRESIKDPKDILERSLIISELQAYGTEHTEELLAVLNPKTIDEEKKLRETILSKFVLVYELDENPNAHRVLESIKMQDSKYLANFFKARREFRISFKEFVELIANNIEKSPQQIFESLESNIKTKELLMENGVDFDKYVNYNPMIYVDNIKNTYGEPTNIKVRKVNMNNILKSLTLGNDAGCCTRIDGTQGKSAIAYTKNKMFSAIEVLDDKTPIGNTMGYFAIVNQRLAYIIDNIELKQEYTYSDIIRDAIIKCARKLTNEVVEGESVPIFLSANRHKIRTIYLPLAHYDIKILGNTGNDKAYIDFRNKSLKIDDESCENKNLLLYDVSFIADDLPCPNNGSVKPPGLIRAISNNEHLNL